METEQQTQQSTPLPSAYQNPMYNYGSSIVTLTDTSEELKKMELTLRGKRENYEGAVITMGDALLNEQGINSVMGLTQAIANRNAIMGFLNKDDIPMMIDFLADTLAKDLMLNRTKYNITNPSARDKIFFEALSTVFLCLKRGFDEGDRRFWKGSQQDIRQIMVNENQKSGFLSKLNPFGKGG